MDIRFRAFIALFYAMDKLYELYPCDTTALCAGELDPFLFNTVGSADPAYYLEFCEAYAQRFNGTNVSPSECYAFAQEFAATLSDAFHAMYPDDPAITDLFAKYIDDEMWLALWAKASNVTDRRLADTANA